MDRINRKWPLAFGAVALVAAAWFALPRHSAPKPEIRVGVDQSPPFYLIQPDGSVRGLAVDVLNEAARRSGVRLRWVPLHDLPLADALRGRVVDLWPLVGITAERRASFHLTSPWIESDYVLISLKDSPVRTPDEAAGKSVAHARLKFTAMIAQQFLPKSVLTVRRLRADALQALCEGEASAALVESFALDPILLSRPPGCADAMFQVVKLRGATTPLTIAAVPEAARAAEELRSAITDMGEDGFLTDRLEAWSPFAAEGARSILVQENADRRAGAYRFGLSVILGLTLFLAWALRRAHLLRRAAESAEAARAEIQRQFTTFMDHSPATAFMKDEAGRLLYVNKAWTEAFRMPAEDVYGKTDFDLWPKAVARRMREADEALLNDNTARQMVQQVPVAGASPIDWLIVKFPFAGQDGTRFIGGTAIDITERENAIRELRASEARYRELFENNPLPAWVFDRETLAFLTVNSAALNRYGWTREDFLSGMTLCDVLCTEEPCFPSGDGAVIDAAHAQRRTWRHLTKQGLRLTVDVTSYELEYNHRPARLTIMRDLTEQECMLEQLRSSEERWQLALRGAGDALWDWDIASGRVYRSARWSAMLGYAEHEIGDSREDFYRLLHSDDEALVNEAVGKHLALPNSDGYRVEYRLRHKDNTWRWVLDRGQAVWDERSRPLRMAGSITDITARKAAESLLTMQARTDALTGLANRREFERLFAEHFDAARDRHTALSVCLCDLDYFKTVNDLHGHPAGDGVLIAFSAILRSFLRRGDVAARVGGDEFVVSMPHTTADEATVLVEKMREQLRSRSFESAAGRFTVTSSFGVAEYQPDHSDAQSLLADADRLLYDAKGGGRDRTLAA